MPELSWEREPYPYRWKEPQDWHVPLVALAGSEVKMPGSTTSYHDERGALAEALGQFIGRDYDDRANG